MIEIRLQNQHQLKKKKEEEEKKNVNFMNCVGNIVKRIQKDFGRIPSQPTSFSLKIYFHGKFRIPYLP